MKEICIFIDVPFGIGGTFQFNQQILSALLSLPTEKYRLTVFYTEDAWSDLIPASVKKIKLPYPPYLKTLFKLLFTIGTPYWLMRFLYSTTGLRPVSDPRFKLALFPSQDLAGLFLSTNGANVVYDLMHRYEKQFKESSSFGRGRFRDRLFGSICKHSRVILPDSEVGKQQLVESYQADPRKIYPLPYIAPTHITAYHDEQHTEYFEKLSLPKAFMFYPAQFWPHKNHRILVESAYALKKKYPDFHLVFTGPKKYAFQEIFDYCEKNDLLGNVTFLEYVPNEVLGGFYLRARAMVMPTFYGPTNIPPLEAIALGCPVAVSKIYGMPEQLGDASLYFDNTDVADVTRVLEALWSDEGLRNKLRENAVRHFASWNNDSFNKRVFNILESVTSPVGA